MGLLNSLTTEARPRYKICILGDEGVGKTSLIRRYVEDEFEEDYQKNKRIWNIPELYVSVEEEGLPRSEVINLSIWDLVGGLTMRQAYINAKAAILVCDLTEKVSLYTLEYWTTDLFKITGEIPLLVVGNKYDRKSDFVIEQKELKKEAKKLKAKYAWASAKTGENVKKIFYKITQMMI